VADLRDPWALDEMSAYPSRVHLRLELARMRRRLRSASLLIMNTPGAADAVRDAFPELAGRTRSITNGYDAEDFAGPPPVRSDAGFRIVHSGSLHVALGRAHARRRRWRRLLGGERVPVDILTRSHVFLLRALEAWQQAAPEEVARVELVLAGDASEADREVVAQSAVADRVRFTGYVSHAESIAWLRSADLLFLPMHALPPGERARIVPGKTYEYLAAKRPILAAVPEGDARDFVRESGLGDVCEPHDARAMCAALRRRFGDAQAGRVAMPAPDAFYARFERRTQAAALAGALDELL
jgi:glycosyltransferase involved in cell wall biosynthesis